MPHMTAVASLFSYGDIQSIIISVSCCLSKRGNYCVLRHYWDFKLFRILLLKSYDYKHTLQTEFLPWWKPGLDTGLFLVQCSLCIRGGLFFWIPYDGKRLAWRTATVKVSAAVLVKGCPQSNRVPESLSLFFRNTIHYSTKSIPARLSLCLQWHGPLRPDYCIAFISCV
jgi:hypothetical protein